MVVLGPDRFLLPALICTVLALMVCRGRLEPAAPDAGSENSSGEVCQR